MNTYTSTSSEGTTATRNSKNATFAFAVWMSNTEANAARNWWLAGPYTLELRCTNWFSSLKSAESIANRYRREGFRVEIRPANHAD